MPSFIEVEGETRPFVLTQISDNYYPGLLDSGSHREVCGAAGVRRLDNLGYKHHSIEKDRPGGIRTADGTLHRFKFLYYIPMKFEGIVKIITVYAAPTLKGDLVFGLPFMAAFDIRLRSPKSEWIPRVKEGDNEICMMSAAEVPTEAELEEEELEKRRDLTLAQERKLDEVIREFEALGKIPLGRTHLISHDIDTGDNKPCYSGTRVISPMKEKLIEQEFFRFKELGVIEPAQTAYRNCMTMVERQKMGKLKLRLCMDSRKLNAITKVEKYDIPRIDSILSRLGKARYMSKIDLKDAYLQIPLTERSKEKTAFFIRGHGVWQFVTMPFGLVNCSATMQRLMDTLFGDLDGEIFVYQDDLITVHENFEDHLKALKYIADKIRYAGLSINFEKSGFCLKNMRYMGYVVDEGGLKPDPEKVECVLKVPLPQTVTELRRFIGMASWYRRFIDSFAIYSAPLHDLIKGGGKGRRLVWNENAISSFEKLKEALVSAPLLSSPDFEKPFMIFCDASDGCIGGVLTQPSEEDPKHDRPVAYVSRKLRGPEVHYSTTEKECLAVVFCVNKFLEYIEGTQFTVCTDHSALTWLFKQKELSGRLARWVLSLQQHSMTIKHVKGKSNVVADAISRFPICQILEYVELFELACPSRDKWYDALYREVKMGDKRSERFRIQNGKLYYDSCGVGRKRLSNFKYKLVVPYENRKKILEECHDDPKSGHMGVQKTLNRVFDRYYWNGMAKDVKTYVKNCIICRMSKPSNEGPAGLMGKFRSSDNPWQMISADIMGPLPRSRNGYTSILVVSDWFTKFPCILPLRQAKAKNVINAIEREVFLKFGVAETIIMDNGPQFARSNEMKSFLDRYGVKNLWSNCSYHPQSNFTERHNRNLGTALRSYVKENHRDWDKHLPEIALALQTAVHSITGYSPFFLNYAREYVKNPSDYELIASEEGKDCYANRTDFMKKFDKLSDEIHGRMHRSYLNNKKHYDISRRSVTFNEGDEVFLRNFVKSDASKSFSKKLAPKYVPGTISRKVSPIVFEVNDHQGNSLGKWHVQDMRRGLPIDEKERNSRGEGEE